MSRDEALAHAAGVAAATKLPVNADLEACFADAPEGVAETIRLATETGVAGCSLEDWSGEYLYEAAAAADRVRAAAEAAHTGTACLALTARAENYLRRRPDLADTIARLQSFQEAGADVLYAPGLFELSDIAQVVSAVDLPVNIIILPGGPTIPQLAEVNVARVSVGGAFSTVALGAVVSAARELLDTGTHEFWNQARQVARLATKLSRLRDRKAHGRCRADRKRPAKLMSVFGLRITVELFTAPHWPRRSNERFS